MRISDWSSDVCSSDLDAARARLADRIGVEQQKVGGGADRDAAAVPDAVEAGRLAGELTDGLFEREGPALPYPMAEKLQPVSGVAEIGRASCRERECQYG